MDTSPEFRYVGRVFFLIVLVKGVYNLVYGNQGFFVFMCYALFLACFALFGPRSSFFFGISRILLFNNLVSFITLLLFIVITF